MLKLTIRPAICSLVALYVDRFGQTKSKEQESFMVEAEEDAQRAALLKTKPDDMMFLFGHCGQDAPANRKAFKRDALGIKTWCSECKKSGISVGWKCKCGMHWRVDGYKHVYVSTPKRNTRSATLGWKTIEHLPVGGEVKGHKTSSRMGQF